jgi:N-acetylmuramoyl-L-alanine amidase
MYSMIMPHFLLRIRSDFAVLMLMALFLLPFRTLFALPAEPSGQTTVPLNVSTGNDQGYTIRVLALRRADMLMIDLESLVRALRMNYSKEPGGLVVEESFGMPGTICTITPGNNFVRVLSRNPELPKRIIQLPSAPLLMQSRIWLPVTQACRLLAVWLDREVVYNSSSGQISVLLGRKSFGELTGTIGVVSNEELQPAAAGSIRPTEPGRTVITGIEVKNRANGAIISFSASGPAAQASLITLNAEGYTCFSLEKASCDINALTKVYNKGVVKSITPREVSGAGLQFTIALDNRSFVINSVEYQRDKKHNSYLLYIRSNADVEEIHRKEKERQITRVLSRDVEKWKLDTIVLDAGHGGKDPGATGGNGVSEKDVALNIVRDLGMFITQKWPDVRVIYTRKEDTFVPLHDRGKIANQSGGKLFISVHCNASFNRNAHGSEVYILGPHKTKEALDVAMLENSVIRKEPDDALAYKGFSEEYLIMSSMAQSAFVRQSTSLAQHILNPDDRQFNYSRGVRQAGFMVLWTPSMPSALVEVGYLSNPAEEKILRDRQEQTKIAYAIFQGVQTYRKNYETSSMAAMER